MKIIALLFFLFIILTSFAQNSSKSTGGADFNNFKSEGNYTYKIIEAPEHTFGYEISTKGKVTTCAKFVIGKLNKNIMPPSVSPNELDSLWIM